MMNRKNHKSPKNRSPGEKREGKTTRKPLRDDIARLREEHDILRRGTAIHEAGHAVVAEAMGVRVEHVVVYNELLARQRLVFSSGSNQDINSVAMMTPTTADEWNEQFRLCFNLGAAKMTVLPPFSGVYIKLAGLAAQQAWGMRDKNVVVPTTDINDATAGAIIYFSAGTVNVPESPCSFSAPLTLESGKPLPSDSEKILWRTIREFIDSAQAALVSFLEEPVTRTITRAIASMACSDVVARPHDFYPSPENKGSIPPDPWHVSAAELQLLCAPLQFNPRPPSRSEVRKTLQVAGVDISAAEAKVRENFRDSGVEVLAAEAVLFNGDESTKVLPWWRRLTAKK
jgi:hypothetical protein